MNKKLLIHMFLFVSSGILTFLVFPLLAILTLDSLYVYGMLISFGLFGLFIVFYFLDIYPMWLFENKKERKERKKYEKEVLKRNIIKEKTFENMIKKWSLKELFENNYNYYYQDIVDKEIESRKKYE